jgi:endoglucanase
MSFLECHEISQVNWSISDKVETASALKPGASPTGGWEEDVISPSGKLVRDYIRSRNTNTE